MALRSEDGESGTNANKTLNGRAAAQNSVFLSLLWLFKYAQWARVSLDAFAWSCETRFSKCRSLDPRAETGWEWADRIVSWPKHLEARQWQAG